MIPDAIVARCNTVAASIDGMRGATAGEYAGWLTVYVERYVLNVYHVRFGLKSACASLREATS